MGVKFSSISYEGVHVVITGGSSGIGFSLAKEYLRLGANVTIAARNLSRLQSATATLSELTKPGQRIIFCAVDVSSSEETVRNALKNCIDTLGPIEVLVNCAGTSIAGAFEDLSTTDFENMLKINVLGSVYPTRVVVPTMKVLKRGRIIFVASQAAQLGMHGYSAYSASKWALRGLAEVLQMELKPFGVAVTVVYPPDTETPGYATEMLSKPAITKKLSESGTVFHPDAVAKATVRGSTVGLFGVAVGLDGWLLKQLHPGMSPINNLWELLEGILCCALARIISVFYLLAWDRECKVAAEKAVVETTSTGVEKKKER